MKTGYVVADIMTTKPVTCKSTISIKEAAQLLKKHDVRSVLVMDGHALRGIVTDKDFVYRALAEGLDCGQPVSRIMSPTKYTVEPGIDLFDAVKLMNKHGVHHLPVMEEDKLAGYLTMSNILKVEPQLMEILAEKAQIRSVSPNSPLAYLSEDEEGL